MSYSTNDIRMKTKWICFGLIVAWTWALPANVPAAEEPWRLAPWASDNYLLIDQAGIDAAKQKADTQPWAKAARDAVISRATAT